MKNEKPYTIEVKLLFRDIELINSELPKIKNDLGKIFENIIVHYDLSDEVDELDRECVGIRIELLRYGAEKDLAIINNMSKDAIRVICNYNVRDYSVKAYKD